MWFTHATGCLRFIHRTFVLFPLPRALCCYRRSPLPDPGWTRLHTTPHHVYTFTWFVYTGLRCHTRTYGCGLHFTTATRTTHPGLYTFALPDLVLPRAIPLLLYPTFCYRPARLRHAVYNLHYWAVVTLPRCYTYVYRVICPVAVAAFLLRFLTLRL